MIWQLTTWRILWFGVKLLFFRLPPEPEPRIILLYPTIRPRFPG